MGRQLSVVEGEVFLAVKAPHPALCSSVRSRGNTRQTSYLEIKLLRERDGFSDLVSPKVGQPSRLAR